MLPAERRLLDDTAFLKVRLVLVEISEHRPPAFIEFDVGIESAVLVYLIGSDA
jgi:hypothetical protein